MNYDDLYTVLKNASAATLSKMEQTDKVVHALVQRYHMWRFVVEREYKLQYFANHDESDPTHMRPQMKAFLDAMSNVKENEGTYWKRLYEFLHARLDTWGTGTFSKGVDFGLRTLMEQDNNETRPVQTVAVYLPEIDEIAPGTQIAVFALNYVRRGEDEEEEEEREQKAFEMVVNEQGDGLSRGKTLKRQDADEQSMFTVTVTFGGRGQLVAPDGRFRLALMLTPARFQIGAFFFKDLATTEKLVSHAIQASFWI
jgi:hypothetical protein